MAQVVSLKDTMAIDLAEKLVSLIDQKGCTISALSRGIGVAATSVRRWIEPGTTYRPSIYQLLTLSRFFGVTMEYLADDQIEEPIRGSADEAAVLSHYRVQRRKEGESFTPDELAWRIQAPRGVGADPVPKVRDQAR